MKPAGAAKLATGVPGQLVGLLKEKATATAKALELQEKLQQATNYTSDSYDKFGKSLEKSQAALNSLALNTNDAREAQEGLVQGSGAYARMMKMDTHKKFGNQMASLAAQWKAMGVPVATTAKTFELAANQLGMLDKNADLSEQKIKGFFNTLLKQGQLSSQPWQKIQDSTAGAMSKMTLLGKTMTHNMEELQKAFTNTGISQDKFLTMAGKYETVEGAATQVGQLNAVLKGTTLGIGEMMAAEPVDRVKKVIGDVNLAMKEGRFKLAEGGAMRVAQIKALAQAAGIEEQAMDALLRKKMKVEEIFKASGKIKHPTTEAAAKAAAGQLSAEKIAKIPDKTMENKFLTQGKTVSDYRKAITSSSDAVAEGMGKLGDSMKEFAGKLQGLEAAINKVVPAGLDKDKGGFYTQLMFGSLDQLDKLSDLFLKVTKAASDIPKRAKDQITDRFKKKGEKSEIEKFNKAEAAGEHQMYTVDPDGSITVKQELKIPAKILEESFTGMTQ